MTTDTFLNGVIAIVADLSRDLPAEERYKRLLAIVQGLFPCDATALLRVDGDILVPMAAIGLSEDVMGRRFVIAQHPRLIRIMQARKPVHFPADSPLPDPYDGLITTISQQLHVHACFGVALFVDDAPWGALTLDALQPGRFDQFDDVQLRTFISLTEATVKAAARIDALKEKVKHEQLITRTLIQEGGRQEIIGKSVVMQHLKAELNVVAHSDLTVLVLGETGVGKELVARHIHRQSRRQDQPMVYINCAALPENIAESELFGHVKGAFSGATSDRAGKFEIAHGGTLFLDEIGELSLAVQAKMLRVLQSGEIQRVGSDVHREVDVRIVAATNRDLQREVSASRFRADLYHRLSVYPIHVPPLRERGRDILLVAGYLLETNQHRLGLRGVRLDDNAKQVLLNYSWPGNVRELEHLLSRASLKALAQQGRHGRTQTIMPSHLDIDSGDINPVADSAVPKHVDATIIDDRNLTLRDAMDSFKKQLINTRLEQNSGNVAATAAALGLDRGNLHRLVKRLGLR